MYLEITDGPMQHHDEIKQVAQIAIEEYLEKYPHATDGVCESVAYKACLLYTSPSPRDRTRSRMPSSA